MKIIQLKMKDDKLDFVDWINMDYETKMKNNFISSFVKKFFINLYLKSFIVPMLLLNTFFLSSLV